MSKRKQKNIGTLFAPSERKNLLADRVYDIGSAFQGARKWALAIESSSEET